LIPSTTPRRLKSTTNPPEHHDVRVGPDDHPVGSDLAKKRPDCVDGRAAVASKFGEMNDRKKQRAARLKGSEKSIAPIVALRDLS